MSKPKKEYVVVDWGTWGIDVQLSTKIVVKDHLNVKNGDACSLQGTDPVTKRPIMFEGEVLGVFGEYVCSLFDKQMLIYLFFFSWVRAVRSVLKFLLYICNRRGPCSQDTCVCNINTRELNTGGRMHEAVLNIFHLKIHKFSQFCSPNSSSANVFAVFTITLQSL